MNNTRVEILVGTVWRKLEVPYKAVKYNALINRIGNVDSREISHTNTFSLPMVQQNIDAFELNFFNKKSLAKAFNTKYKSRYYVKDVLFQEGYLIINNTENGTINVNFIDEALDIISKWGSTSYYDLLTLPKYVKPADVQTAIDNLSVDLNINSVVSSLGNINNRDYPLASFPHTLNQIGDKFQVNTNGVTPDNTFNPYQCRPLWNARAFLDIVCESFGYTPIYDPSINNETLTKTYISPKDMTKEKKDTDVDLLTRETYGANNPILYYNPQEEKKSLWFLAKRLFTYQSSDALFYGKTGALPVWWSTIPFSYCIYEPNMRGGAVGLINFKASYDDTFERNEDHFDFDLISVWQSSQPQPAPFVFGTVTTISETTTGGVIDVQVDKSQFTTTPTGSDGVFFGLMFQVKELVLGSKINEMKDIYDQRVTETFIEPNIVTYDKDLQYGGTTVDLAYALPKEPIKKILSGLLEKEGWLIDIDSKSTPKTITFFSYGKYQLERESLNFNNWSKYLLKHNPRQYNSDYGNNYGKLNKIGLGSPYLGNYTTLALTNQGAESKYIDNIDLLSKTFKDVSKIITREHPDDGAYFEYTSKGLGLVEDVESNITHLKQTRFDASTQDGTLTLRNIANVNYAVLPEGVKEWFKIVDNSIKGEFQFLIPHDVISKFDITIPIYVEELGGFWIIEEVAEYVDDVTPVTLKLIKMTDDILSEDVSAPSTPQELGANDIEQTTATIFWTPSIDNRWVIIYEIEVNSGSQDLQTFTTRNLELDITGFVQNETVDFRVRASDLAGNFSDWSSWFDFDTEIDPSAFKPFLMDTAQNTTSAQACLRTPTFSTFYHNGSFTYPSDGDFIFSDRLGTPLAGLRSNRDYIMGNIRTIRVGISGGNVVISSSQDC